MSKAILDLTYTEAQSEIFFSDKAAKYIIVPKGRRFGATKGAANACIEWSAEGKHPILWTDTINSNIDRYLERYFIPELKKNDIDFNFNYNKKQLNLFNSIIDFRSADSPESIEGFGYRKIILNEAGIILKDNYLYTNTILPMLIDYPDSQLYAIGTPKGKYKKDGTKHMFYQLSEKTGSDYRQLRYSSYDNPLLSTQSISELQAEIALLDPNMVRQEIYGEFIEMSATNPFMTQYDPLKHESLEAVHDQRKQLSAIIDFNLNPFCLLLAHQWNDGYGDHFHIFDEIEIKNGSIPLMVEEIRLRYNSQIPNMRLAGDSMGKRKEISERDNSSYYIQIKRGLGLRDSQLYLPNNPTHENSRGDCNYVLYHHPDFKINPVKCPNTCRDMRIVQCDTEGKIIKSNRKDISQQADFFDCVRYGINAFLFNWIVNHQKNNYRK